MIHIICLFCLSFLINIEGRLRMLQMKAQAAEAKAFSEFNKNFLKKQHDTNSKTKQTHEVKQSLRCKYFREKAINIRRYLINSTKFYVKDGKTCKKSYHTLSTLELILEVEE